MTTVTPTPATLTLTFFAPTVSTPIVDTPSTLALALTTFAPSVRVGPTVVPATLTLTLTMFAPNVTATQNTVFVAAKRFLGGANITGIGWAGRGTVFVEVDHDSNYDAKASQPDGWRLQLYANRRLIGATRDWFERRVVGPVPVGASASPLGLLWVAPDERLIDFGNLMDFRPFNVYRVSWAAADPSDADTHHYDICAGTSPGAAYDATNIVGRMPHTGQATYAYTLPPFPEPGDWQLAVIPRDDALPLGNAGTPSTTTIAAIVFPVDLKPTFVIDGAPKRFATSISNGVLIATFSYVTPGPYAV